MKDAAQRLAWALEVCRRAQMRLTPIRQMMLAFLAARRVPASLEVVAQSEGIRACYNVTTVYRTLMLLKELEVLRPVSLPNKISYFVLNVPGESCHFLICQRCGQIDELVWDTFASAPEREVFSGRGYAPLYHELGFYGICPACQKQPKPMASAKLPIQPCPAQPLRIG